MNSDMCSFINAINIQVYIGIFNALSLQKGKTPLHVAAEKGSIEVVNSLIKCGASVNIKDWVRSVFKMYL